jgi:hypothetical protein
MNIVIKSLVRWQVIGGGALALGLLCSPIAKASPLDLTHAVVVSRPGTLPDAEKTAAIVLVEELEKRTGIRLATSSSWPQSGLVIAITSSASVPGWKRSVPVRQGTSFAENHAEGFRLYVDTSGSTPVVWVIGADARGTLFGVGKLLRTLDWSRGNLTIDSQVNLASAPAFPIRGHQLGYRAQANSYDAWNAGQFEQYIRELTFFGINSIEGIPFHDDRATPVMKTPRREMNRAIGEICQRYGLDYWVWVPADFDLKDETKRSEFLKRCDQFFHDTPVLTGFSFPGGDPGDNPPQLVIPFLEDVSKLLAQTHPQAKIWMSVQQYKPAEVDYVFNYIQKQSPRWLGGLVAGPSSPPLGEMRMRLPGQYKLRDYPDLTHNKLSQYEVPQWDQAYALTLGREAVNPRPAEYAAIFERTSPYTDGFISYSDGVHDDVNKTIWSALSWDPNQSVRRILVNYARAYFTPAVANEAATAILALEKNWHGPLVDNGAVEGTLLEWQRLEKTAPQLETNWRWQMCLLRANYDAYVRRRLNHETSLESQANAIMNQAASLGAATAMKEATAVLERAVSQPVGSPLRARIVELCDELFHSIGLQTSVPKYYAIGEERGAVLDFVDYPLNNRWWIEDQFKAIAQLASEKEKDERLKQIAAWEHPGTGSFYDDVGNIANEPHVVRCDSANGPTLTRERGTTFWWWDQGKSRARLSWQTTTWPTAMVYEGLDPKAAYVVRSTGYGQALLRVDGDRVKPTITGKQMGDISEFPVPAAALKDRRLILTWDIPTNEGGLNWRQKSRLAEVWLIKKD